MIQWHVVSSAVVRGYFPASDQWIGRCEAWTAADTEDGVDDAWESVGKLPVRRCPTRCRFEAHRLGAVRRWRRHC